VLSLILLSFTLENQFFLDFLGCCISFSFRVIWVVRVIRVIRVIRIIRVIRVIRVIELLALVLSLILLSFTVIF
jgi:hypothetical protein